MTRLVLWPGRLPLAQARWARQSLLVAADGALEVRRGRRVVRHDVAGCLMHPAELPPGLRVSCCVVVADDAGRPRLAIDLAEWVPVGSMAPDQRVGRRLGPPFEDVRDTLADALGCRVSSTRWTGDVPRPVGAPDLAAARVHQLVLLAMAIGVVLPMLVANVATGLVSGLASLGLVLLGLSPTRRWHPRSAPLAWTERAGHLRDEMSLTADGTVLWSMDTAAGLAGAIPVGPEPYRVDRVDVASDAVQLSHRGVRPVHLARRAWGDDAFDRLTSRLVATPGLRVSERPVDGRADEAWWSVVGPHRPATLGVDVGAFVGLASITVVSRLASVVVAVPFGLAALAAAGLAIEQVVARVAATRRQRTA